MNAIGVIRKALESTHNIVNMYLGDLSDADLLVRPAPTANHIAWQVGHLICSENMNAKVLPSVKYPALPAGFEARHDNKNATDGLGYATKAVYLDLFDKARKATIAGVEGVTEADLDKPTGWEFAPTVGELLQLTATHTMMHAGQFTVVRRMLGKPVLF
jgi:hypothetical protein